VVELGVRRAPLLALGRGRCAASCSFSRANFGFSRDFKEYLERFLIEPGRNTLVGRTALEGRTIHIPDVLADPEYTWAEAQKPGSYRTVLAVPMMREGTPVGVLTLTRSEVRPFTDKQIEL
jgi:two-component system NtrC family sensor kinase